MEELTGNFSTAWNCQALTLTSELLDDTLKKAEKERRKYVWSPLDNDYWLAEQSDFDYEYSCPIFLLSDIKFGKGIVIEVDVYAVFENYQGYQNFAFSFAKVFQVEGEAKPKELSAVAKMYAYLRFSNRDYYREADRAFWTQFLTENIVSNETVLIFKEDKEVASTWAKRTFPKNHYNAWIEKCGEFVFAGWAGECGLPVSRVNLKKREQEDEPEPDFLLQTLLVNPSGSNTLKLEIKTFQIESGKRRNWWNIEIDCLEGERRQDLIIFVVVDEYFRMGKVVGYLSSKSVLEVGEYYQSDDQKDYYKVYLDDIANPYYLRVTTDPQSQISEGLFYGVDPHEVIAETIKNYPLDPITAYYEGYDWRSKIKGGLINLTAEATLKMFVNL